MGLKTKKEYIESLRQMKQTVYMFGEKISSAVDNPRLRAGIEATGRSPPCSSASISASS